jgi:hypothetical protein
MGKSFRKDNEHSRKYVKYLPKDKKKKLHKKDHNHIDKPQETEYDDGEQYN